MITSGAARAGRLPHGSRGRSRRGHPFDRPRADVDLVDVVEEGVFERVDEQQPTLGVVLHEALDEGDAVPLHAQPRTAARR